MNKYFTKEYIKECDCEEIRWLLQDGFDIDGDKKRKLPIGNYYSDKKHIYISVDKERPAPWKCGGWWFLRLKNIDDNSDVTLEFPQYNKLIWLPTGDRLDKEIVKICRKDNGEYVFEWIANISSYRVGMRIDKNTYYNYLYSGEHSNPLIAKIKLLKQLLK